MFTGAVAQPTTTLSIVVVAFILQQVSGNVIIKLRSKILSFIGMISFGLYVYHPLLIYWLQDITYLKSNYILFVMSVLVISTVVSYLSYQLLEKPFLRFKSKFMVVKSDRKS